MSARPGPSGGYRASGIPTGINLRSPIREPPGSTLRETHDQNSPEHHPSPQRTIRPSAPWCLHFLFFTKGNQKTR
jgi:hypothetical protein